MIDQLVIGGGIIGLLTAYELLKAGQRVALIERGEIGRESSWAGGGILSPLYPWRFPPAVNDLAQWSSQAYPVLARQLLEESGIDPQWTPSGMLVLDAHEAQVRPWAQRYGQSCQWLEGDQLRELEPQLAPREGRALWLADIAQVRNPRLLKALHTALVRRGLQIYANHTVTGVESEGGAVRGVTTEKGGFAAATVIICGGAWSTALLGELGGVDVEPVKGQMLMFRAEPGLVEHMVLEGGHYVIPRRDGRVLAGSTLEYTGFDKAPTEEARQRLYEAALGLFPALARCPVERHWAGLRPGTKDGIPYISAHPRLRGLYINAGHFRNGVILAPGSARLVADMVLGRKSILDIGEYAVGHPIVT